MEVCTAWINGHCFDESCLLRHSWTTCNHLTNMQEMKDHQDQKAIKGICISETMGDVRLYTGSEDGFINHYEYQQSDWKKIKSGGTDNVGVRCMITKFSWIFIGTTQFIKAYNPFLDTGIYSISTGSMMVSSLAHSNTMLFGGMEDGTIVMWSYDRGRNKFEQIKHLHGHSGDVICLASGKNQLFSGSKDNSIRVWYTQSPSNLQRMQTIDKHTSHVNALSLNLKDNQLISSSLDGTFHVFRIQENGQLSHTNTFHVEKGVITFSLFNVSRNKNIIICSCADNQIRLHEYDATNTRRSELIGKIYNKEPIYTITCYKNTFFTGDGNGALKWWLFQDSSMASSSSS